MGFDVFLIEVYMSAKNPSLNKEATKIIIPKLEVSLSDDLP